MKTAVGLSGGVDSAVCAYLLREQGDEVIGVTMKLLPGENTDARKVAEFLRIPFYEIDLTREYNEKIIEYVKDDYRNGRTPNPCVRCNRDVKFGFFWEKIKEAGIEFDRFATGHYAVIDFNEKTKRWQLKKGTYAEKDQAYFLAMLTQEQLSKTVFPLGTMSKQQVREIAARAGLPVAEKKESQDLCVGDYKQFFPEDGSGPFIELPSGKEAGRHRGIFRYTVGQRRGLNIGIGYPLFVLKIEPETNTVYVGKEELLMRHTVRIRDVCFGTTGECLPGTEGTIKIRYRDEGRPGRVRETGPDGTVVLEWDEAARAVTPGQLCVFYEGDYVGFAGFIC